MARLLRLRLLLLILLLAAGSRGGHVCLLVPSACTDLARALTAVRLPPSPALCTTAVYTPRGQLSSSSSDSDPGSCWASALRQCQSERASQEENGELALTFAAVLRSLDPRFLQQSHVVLLGSAGDKTETETETEADRSLQDEAFADTAARLCQQGTRPLSVTFVVNGTDAAIGSAGASVTYRDGSEFNVAQTLRALQRAGQGHCLQAFLLGCGLSARVASADQLGATAWRTMDNRLDQRQHDAPDTNCAGTLLCRDATRESAHASYTDEHLARADVDVIELSAGENVLERVVPLGKPVIVRGSAIDQWEAVRAPWSLAALADALRAQVAHGDEPHISVKRARDAGGATMFDPDWRAPMSRLSSLARDLPYDTLNVSISTFFRSLEDEDADRRAMYYFGRLPASLERDVMPARPLFLSDIDQLERGQFLWISGAGLSTHTHFDQDYNVFVQLRGRKRFTLWPPPARPDLYAYPRIHPMWHKSRVDFDRPPLALFPAYGRTEPLRADLGPGDVLYIPPYTWHHVRTLSPSVSLTTWSRVRSTYDNMEAIYGYVHKFDGIASPAGRRHALRLYLDLLLYRQVGYNATTGFMQDLLDERYRGLEPLFGDLRTREPLCGDRIPTARHVYGDASLDRDIVGRHFDNLADQETRDILLRDYVEELAAQVVGAENVLQYFRECFRGQPYHVTADGEEEHAMWDAGEPPTAAPGG